MLKREYANYEAYLKHQREKTTDPKLREKMRKRWETDVRRFEKAFLKLRGRVARGERVICLGARLGAEVFALKDYGFDAIGIDLEPAEPLVVKGDFHAIPFKDGEFRAAYSNSVDHVYDLAKFAAEVRRVLKRPGWLLVCLAMQNYGKYESIRIDSTAEFLEHFSDFEVIEQTSNEKPGRSERIDILLRIDDEEK